MVRRRGRVLVAAACVLLAAVSAVAVPAPGPPDAAASTVLAQPANHCAGIDPTPRAQITVGADFSSEVWELLCDGTIDLYELRAAGGRYYFDTGNNVSQAHLLTWLNRLSGGSMSGLTGSFVNPTYIQRQEAAASFVTAFGLNPSAFSLPTGFEDVPACASPSDRNCHAASRHIRALHVCRYMYGYVGGNAADPGVFRPATNLSRGQAAAVISRSRDGCADLRVESLTVDTVDGGGDGHGHAETVEVRGCTAGRVQQCDDRGLLR